MTGYLLDTSILVTLGRLKDPLYIPLRRWLDDQPDEAVFVCAVAIGELMRGVAASPDSVRREREHWLHHTVIPAFPVLDFDLDATLRWGSLMGEGQRRGRMPPTDDAKIAAVATVRGLTVATLNARDFSRIGVPYLDPTKP